jgi:hypothetical protein
MSAFYKMLVDAPDAWRAAYEMVLAVSRHIEDLTEDDAVDASEGFTADELKQARSAVRQLERVYADVINRVQP